MRRRLRLELKEALVVAMVERNGFLWFFDVVCLGEVVASRVLCKRVRWELAGVRLGIPKVRDGVRVISREAQSVINGRRLTCRVAYKEKRASRPKVNALPFCAKHVICYVISISHLDISLSINVASQYRSPMASSEGQKWDLKMG